MAWRVKNRWLAVAAVGVWLYCDQASAQFSPRGRKRDAKPSRPPATAPSKSRTPNAPNKPAQPSAKSPTPRTPDATPDEAKKGKPSNEALIARYTAIALQQPGVTFPLQRLGELYRERDGNLDALRADLEKRLTDAPDSLALLMALSWVHESEGDTAKAEALLRRAEQAHPKHAAPLLALANIAETKADKSATAAYLERALPLQREALEREQTLRRLRSLALDAGDVARARGYHDQLVKEAKGSSFVRAELGKELLDRRENAEAVTAFEEVVKAAAGDNRALAPALRDLAKAQAAAGKTDAAIKTLERALGLTTSDSGVHREVLDVMVDTFRAAGRMPELLTQLERGARGDVGQLARLGALYEEAGRFDDALTRYRQALASAPSNTDVRLRLIRLLELRGDLTAAVAEYHKLIAANPRSPEYVFQLADLLQKLGNTKAALDELAKLSERSQTDPEVLASTVDFYERIGESDKALRLLEKLVAQNPRDHHHLIALGERYFAAGDEKRAETIWRRLREVVPDRAHAEFLLGEVYLEHDMTSEALVALGKACELAPSNVQYRKTLALALERTGATSGKAARSSNYAEAQALWEKILTGSDNPVTQREARQHITTLWSLQGSLKDRVAPLEAAFAQTPPHLASGRMLAEVYQRLNQFANAERVLRRLVTLTPNDAAVWSTLERVLVSERKLGEASDVAKKLLQLEPKRALEHYQRLARYAADLYRDDEAIEYAAKAVQLSPDDADGHKRLGDMYRRRQDTERALAHYRKALEKNDRLFPVYFDMAELLLLTHKPAEADQLLRAVLRSAIEDEVIARAARLSMQLHVADGSLEALEQDLLPLSLSRTNKPIYRSLLLELYNAWMLPLAQRATNPDRELALRAKQQLAAIGQRSVKPLLDALGDTKPEQQRTAIELLSYLQNPNANRPLLAYALGPGEPELQTKAMLAIGMAGADNVAPQLEPLLFADGRAIVDESSPLALAAAWSYTRLTSKSTTPRLLLLAQSDSPTAQVLALLALAERREPRTAELLVELLSEGRAKVTRAAAAYAAGQLGRHAAEQSPKVWAEVRPMLRGLATSSDELLHGTAIAALAWLGDGEVPALTARGLLQANTTLRDNATRAMALYAARTTATDGAVGSNAAPVSSTGRLDTGRIDAVQLLEAVLPAAPDPATLAALLPRLETEIVKAARPALQQSEEVVQTIALALTTPPRLGWHPLTAQLDTVDVATRTRAQDAAKRIAQALTPEFVVQSTHPNLAVRMAAARVLSTQNSDEARAAVEAVLARGDEETCRAVLAALSDFPNPALLPAVAALLAENRAWPLRQLAAATLRELGAKAPASIPEAVSDALLVAAERDSNAFVREQALRAWATWHKSTAQPVLTRIAASDPEERVRRLAEALLEGRE